MSTALDTVFLHGFMGFARDWDAVIAALGTGVALELPGHGDTPLDAAGAPPSLDAWADWVAAQLPRVRCLVGYSLGGRLALRVAARHPELAERVVLVSAHPGLVDPAERSARAALDSERAQSIRRDFRAFLTRWYASPLFALSPAQQRALVARRARQDAEGIATIIEAMSPGRAPASWEVVRRLERQPGALSVVVGRRDTKYASLWAQHPGVVTLEAGHAVHMEAAEALAHRLRQWVQVPG